MKYKTIGAFKNVQNIGYCKATTDMMVGMGAIVDRVNKTVALPADDTEAAACHYIVTNINEKPEIPMLNAYNTVLEGEFVRVDDLITVAEMEIEFAASEISDEYSEIAVGDLFVFGTDGLLAKTADASGYTVYFEVLELTAYMDAGILAVIHIQ